MNRKKLRQIMTRLRNPQKFPPKIEPKPVVEQKPARPLSREQKSRNRFIKVMGGVVFGLVVLSLLFILSAQKKASNITAALDPAALKGLSANQAFSPTSGKRYVQITEGQVRSVNDNRISSLPVVSRFNYRALTPRSYEIIGVAPWALSINVTSNLEDPALLRYLFNNEKTIQGFTARSDVAPYLEDPEQLAGLASDEKAVAAFFAEEAVQKTLDSEKVFKAIVGSRLFSTLLISKSAKYYREHPNEAAKLIAASPTLSALTEDPVIRQAVKENAYLKNIADVLLK